MTSRGRWTSNITVRLTTGMLTLCFLPNVGCAKESLNELSLASLPADIKTVSLRLTGLCPDSRSSLKNIFVINESVHIRQDSLFADWDRDGLDNLMDSSMDLDLDYRKDDTNEDGYSDLVMFALGLNYKQQSQLSYCADPSLDFDGDGLSDCEEGLLHTDPNKMDTDGDLIADRIELRAGLNPLDIRDSFQDTDSDGISNMEEIRRGSPPSETNTARTNSLIWASELQSYNSNNSTCYNLLVTNMPVLEVSNGNLIRISVIHEELPPFPGTPPRNVLTDYVVVVPRTIENGAEIKEEFGAIENGGQL